MTLITINLLVEEERAQQAEARDPFKLSIAIGLGLLAIAAAAGVWLSQAAGKAALEVSGLQAKMDKLQQIQGGDDTKAARDLGEDILSINQSRFLYSPQLALIKDIVPETIHLSQMGFSLTVKQAASPPPTDLDDTKASAAKAARRAPKATEMLVLTLNGQAISSRPEIAIDEFIKTMRQDAGLSQFVSDIQLRSIARTPTAPDAASGLTSAAFVIDCQYKVGK